MKIISRGKIFLLLSFASLSLFSGGFSTWIIGANNPVIQGQITVGDVITNNLLKSVGSTTFKITKGGIVSNETIIEECGIDFKFMLDASKLSSSITNINLNSEIVFSNINSSIEPFLIETSVTENDTNSKTVFTGSFTEFDSATNSQRYIGHFNINVDPSSQTNKLFYVTYKFKGNFYNVLTGDLNMSLKIN